MKIYSQQTFLFFHLTLVTQQTVKMEPNHILFMFFCVIGCSYFVFKSIEQYFNYDTVTDQVNELESVIKPVKVDICSYVLEGLDRKIMKKYGYIGKKYPIESNEYFTALISSLTLQDIFDHSENISLKRCLVRTNNGRILTPYFGIECADHFKLKKFIMGEWMCYMIEPTLAGNIPVQNIATSGFGLVYQIHFDNSFKRKYIKPVIHIGNDPPLFSSRYTSYDKVSKSSKFIRYSLKYQMFILGTLGLPYTRYICSSYARQYMDCVRNCTYRETLREYNKIIFDYPLETSMDQTMVPSYHSDSSNHSTKLFDQHFITPLDIVDEEISKKLDSINQKLAFRK